MSEAPSVSSKYGSSNGVVYDCEERRLNNVDVKENHCWAPKSQQRPPVITKTNTNSSIGQQKTVGCNKGRRWQTNILNDAWYSKHKDVWETSETDNDTIESESVNEVFDYSLIRDDFTIQEIFLCIGSFDDLISSFVLCHLSNVSIISLGLVNKSLNTLCQKVYHETILPQILSSINNSNRELYNMLYPLRYGYLEADMRRHPNYIDVNVVRFHEQCQSFLLQRWDATERMSFKLGLKKR